MIGAYLDPGLKSAVARGDRQSRRGAKAREVAISVAWERFGMTATSCSFQTPFHSPSTVLSLPQRSEPLIGLLLNVESAEPLSFPSQYVQPQLVIECLTGQCVFGELSCSQFLIGLI